MHPHAAIGAFLLVYTQDRVQLIRYPYFICQAIIPRFDFQPGAIFVRTHIKLAPCALYMVVVGLLNFRGSAGGGEER